MPCSQVGNGAFYPLEGLRRDIPRGSRDEPDESLALGEEVETWLNRHLALVRKVPGQVLARQAEAPYFWKDKRGGLWHTIPGILVILSRDPSRMSRRWRVNSWSHLSPALRAPWLLPGPGCRHVQSGSLAALKAWHLVLWACPPYNLFIAKEGG